MPLTLRQARLSDVDALTDVFFSAFRKDLVMALCFPKKPHVEEFWATGLSRDIEDPNVHIVCVVDADLPGEPVVAYAQWKSPEYFKSQDGHDAGALYPEGNDPELADAFFGRLKQEREKMVAGGNAWYLGCLCCHEDHQGKGAGSLLMRHGLELADNGGADLYVEASPPGVPLYKKCGFKEVNRVVVLDGKYIELLMWREAPN